MREILFRGKRVDNGEWVVDNSVLFFAETASIYGALNRWREIEVDRETIGQYTGVKDKNGKMIFEDDIVAYNGGMHKVVFEQRCDSAYFGIVMGDNETWALGGSVQGYMLEVVGNIYDNKEANA